jgi:hypothetical protein
MKPHDISQVTPVSPLSSIRQEEDIFFMSLPRDIKEFLDGYPGNPNDLSRSTNVEFYSNKRRCRPDNMQIDDIHERYVSLFYPHPFQHNVLFLPGSWYGEYDKLEYKHGFIQWL